MVAMQRRSVLFILLLVSAGLFGIFFSHQQQKGINTSDEGIDYKTTAGSNRINVSTTEESTEEKRKNYHTNSKPDDVSGSSAEVYRTDLAASTENNISFKFCPDSPFQSIEEIDFPTVQGNSPRVPRIIHQIFTNEYVPLMYKPLIKSFTENNPSWQYRFWTYESGRQLLKKFHPYLVKIYTDFGSSVKKADLLRYAIIHEFGGFYFDLDTENFRPLDRVTFKYACIFPATSFETSVLKIGKPFHLINCMLICRPKHPFVKQLLWNLRNATATGNVSDTTGPRYITQQFMKYSGISEADIEKTKTDLTSNSPYFFKGQMKEEDNDAVYIPNSQYFMDKINPVDLTVNGFLTSICKDISILPPLSKCACVEIERRKRVRETRKYSFTVHHFHFLWGKRKTFIDNLNKIHIGEIVQNCILYHG